MANYDVIIIGAGLSGIGAAFHVQDKCPNKSYAVLEGRANIGGTWDLFKYPGIRSDSDMFTLGFPFNPWKNPKAIADGPAILQYIKDTANKFGITEKIKFNHKVINADWSDQENKWTLTIACHEFVSEKVIQCNYLFTCCGYYDYENGNNPDFKNSELFIGDIIHPQKWNDSISYENKKVVVIGSGATAVTLVPEMAKKAEKVTMLQRSPSYIMTLPSEDKVANFMNKILPSQLAHTMTRWKNVMLAIFMYNAARRWPDGTRKFLQKGVKKELGDKFELKHFDPKYDPWDQRLCLVPDSDLFDSIKSEKAEIVTDTIKNFTKKGVLLDSGKEIEADIIVTATGLKLQLLGGMTLSINGEQLSSGKLHCYRGVLFSDVPNFAFAIGYTNASWTLKCDLNCHFVTRILNHMEEKNFTKCVAKFDDTMESEPLLDFDAGYVKRALDILPKQGSKAPWKVYQNYIKDTISLKYGKVDDEYLVYE